MTQLVHIVLTTECSKKVMSRRNGENPILQVMHELPISHKFGARLLAITSSLDDDIECDVDDGVGGVNTIMLDGPNSLLGAGIIAQPGAAPGKDNFPISAGDSADVVILVGRDAIL